MHFVFKTRNNNYYMYDSDKKKFVIIPIEMYSVYKILEDNEFDFSKAKEIIEKKDILRTDDGKIKKDKALYYLGKIRFLKESGLFSETPFTKRKFDGRLTGEGVKRSLANTKQVTFETTERCNLKCKYCGYGEFYDDYDVRERKDLDIEKAKIFLKYMEELWNSPYNVSHGNNIYISFYGGEPLVNFRFVKEIVEFTEKLNLKHNRFTFSMTTNGVLLGKHMDFLAEKKFNLLISLDGNKWNNSYRVFESGKESFEIVVKNVNQLRDKYPEYFKERVNFNAVLHNRNSVSEIHEFFKKNYDKTPSIGELNNVGIREDKIEEFRRTYQNVYESLFSAEDYTYIEKEMFINLPTIQNLSTFVFQYSDSKYETYDDFFTEEGGSFIPTGTCLPFSKKVFITAKGKILPCERVPHKYGLGFVKDDGVDIDFEKIAEKYNGYYDKLRGQCEKCYNRLHCGQCMLQLDMDSDKPVVCNGFMNKKDYTDYLSANTGFLEEEPENYEKIMKEVIIEY